MARIPILTRETSPGPELEPVFDALDELGLQKFANQFGVLANHPALAQAMTGVLRAYYAASTVPRKYLEMAVLLVSVRNRCRYCVVHHSPPALDSGLSRAQLAAIEDDTWADSGLFDAIELNVLRFTDQVSARSGRVDESLFAAMREHFDDRQLVELTVRSAMCEFFNRFNETFQIDMESIAEALYRTAAEEPADSPPTPTALGD